jgi:hypothetical protein
MKTTGVKEMVRNWYGTVAAGNAGCCGSNVAPQEVSRSMGYSKADSWRRNKSARPAG